MKTGSTDTDVLDMEANVTNGGSWAEIHAMFADVRARLERLGSDRDESAESLLRRRAQEYRGATAGAAAGTPGTQRLDALRFALGADTYAIFCDEIEEVVPMQNLIALPHTSRSILGISNHRGILFVVIDLKRILNIPASDLTTMHRVIIVRHDDYKIGLLVDAVQGMRSIDLDGVQQLPDELHLETRRHIRGITEDDTFLLRTGTLVQQIAEGNAAGRSGGANAQQQHTQVRS